MALNPVDRESNMLDSIKKFFYDTFHTGEGVVVFFDRTFTVPDTTDLSLKKWIRVVPDNFNRQGYINEQRISIYCCTREDKEGFVLSQLRDKILGYLKDDDMPDGMKRIPLYKSSPTDPWVELTKMVVDVDHPVSGFDAPDGTKYKHMTIILRWGGA